MPAALDGVAQVVARLVHLSKYANVRELDVPDKGAAQFLEVSVTGAQSGADGSAPIYRDGDKVKLTNQEYPTTQPG